MYYINNLNLVINNLNAEFDEFFSERCLEKKNEQLNYSNEIIIKKDITLKTENTKEVYKNVSRSSLFQIYNNLLGSLINDKNNLYIHSTLISKNNKGILILGNFGQGKTYLANYAKEKGFKINSSDQTWLQWHKDKLILKLGSSFVKEKDYKYNLEKDEIIKPIEIVKIVIIYGLCDNGTFKETILENTEHIYKRIFPFANWHYAIPLINGGKLRNTSDEISKFLKHLIESKVVVSTIRGDKKEIIANFQKFLLESDSEFDGRFVEALKKNNLAELVKIPKADLHIHGALGGNPKDLGITTIDKYNGYSGMKTFISELNMYMDTKEKYRKMLELTIKNAIKNGVTRLEMSIDIRYYTKFFTNIDEYVSDIKSLKKLHPNVSFDIGISKSTVIENFRIINKMIKTRLFDGIDLYGDEDLEDLERFTEIYKLAEKYHLQRKIHIGEYGKKNIPEIVWSLNPTMIQHGLSILRENSLEEFKTLLFNISIISNYKLGSIKNIEQHPIKRMFSKGLYVTLSTDDPILFNNTIIDEYVVLYNQKIFTAEELNIIRKIGLYY